MNYNKLNKFCVLFSMILLINEASLTYHKSMMSNKKLVKYYLVFYKSFYLPIIPWNAFNEIFDINDAK